MTRNLGATTFSLLGGLWLACVESDVALDASAGLDGPSGAGDAVSGADAAQPSDLDCAPPVLETANLSDFALFGLTHAPLGGVDTVYRATGRLEVSPLDFGSAPLYQRLTVQPSGEPSLSVGVFPAPPAETGDEVTLRVAVDHQYLRRVTLIELYDSSGALTAAYWRASAPLEGGGPFPLRPAIPMTVGPLTIDYEPSECEMIPWWADDCGVRRMSNLIVTTEAGARVEVRPGHRVELPSGHAITNDPRSYHEASFTRCLDLSDQMIGGFLLQLDR